MNEFEVLQYFQSGFQQNASYLLVVTILICLNFYLIRRARETNMPSYGKALVTIFGLMTVYFGWTVGTFLKVDANKHGCLFGRVEKQWCIYFCGK